MKTRSSLKPGARLLSLIALLLSLTSFVAAQQKDEPSAPPVQNANQTEAAKNRDAAKGEAAIDELGLLKTKVEQLQKTVEEQQRVLAELKRLLYVSQPSAADTQSPESSAKPEQPEQPKKVEAKAAEIIVGWGKEHAFIKSADGNFETNFIGFAQLDVRGYQSGNHPPNTFLIRRARLGLEGKVAKYYEFKVEADFADTNSTLLRDSFINVHRWDWFQIRAGQFKEPFSQEELRSDTVQDFVERSLVNNLSPSRSPGVLAFGKIYWDEKKVKTKDENIYKDKCEQLEKENFRYELGVFNGKGLLAANTTGTPEGIARMRVAPWRHQGKCWMQGLAFGGAFALGRNSVNAASVRGLTESRSFTFFMPVPVNGPSLRANGELTWLINQAAIRIEYDQTNQARNRLGLLGANLSGVVAKGYTGQFTYLFGASNKPDVKPVIPKRNLFGNRTGMPGAWELKFRYSNLQISDGTTKSNRAETIYSQRVQCPAACCAKMSG